MKAGLADALKALLEKCVAARVHDLHVNGPQMLPAARAELENWMVSEGNGQKIVDELRR